MSAGDGIALAAFIWRSTWVLAVWMFWKAVAAWADGVAAQAKKGGGGDG